ncbi:MAG: DoxX family protein [Dehalococcoidia bacterium]
MHNLGLLAIRIAAGVLFAAHGYAKLFGGEGKSVHERAQRYLGDGFTQAVARGGPSNFARGLERMGVPAPRFMAFVVGGTEFVGGLLLVFGFLTRPAALGLAVNMVFAIKLAHWKQGLIGSASGYMYALSMLGSMLGLLFLGAGALSADSEAVRRLRARAAGEPACWRGSKSRVGIV